MKSVIEQWDFLDDPFSDYMHLLPKEADFIEVCNLYNKTKYNNSNTLAAAANQLASTINSEIKLIRVITVAIILHWDELVAILKFDWFNKYNHSIDDLKEVITFISANIAEINNFINMYINKVINNTISTTSNINTINNIYMISAYDSYDGVTKGARRHIRVGKKDKNTGLYQVIIDSAEISSWDNLFVFDNLSEIDSFINNVKNGKAQTKRQTSRYIYAIKNKFYPQMYYKDINDFVKVNTTCGPAYICKYSQYCED